MTKPPEVVPRLTKDDTVALWHAIDDMANCNRAMRDMPTISEAQRSRYDERLRAARRALAKVNKIRKAQP